MISDEDVHQFFQNKLDVPSIYGGVGSLQIFRGLRHLPGEPPGGCQRHKTVFNKFNVIPEYCFDCYKVLIAPRTVMELFKLLMIFEKLVLPNDNTRKCMAEGRADTAGTYKGFIYCRSLVEGKEIRKTLKGIVADNISPDVPVALKRGCSEFSRVHPRYAKIKLGTPIMRYPKEWKTYEVSVDKDFAFTQEGSGMDRADSANSIGIYLPSEIFAMQYWLRYAATIGDVSYLKITDRALQPIPQLTHPPFSFS